MKPLSFFKSKFDRSTALNILYYIEPWIQYHKPSWKKDYIWWLGDLSAKLADVCKVNTHFVLNESCAKHHASLDRCKSTFSVITHDELTAIFPDDISALNHWQHGDDANLTQQMQSLIADKIGDFTPDIILTITPAPFFEAMFPDAVIIHRDAMYIREPFPDELTSFDPCGLYDNAQWCQQLDRIRQMPFNDEDQSFLCRFRDIFIPDIAEANPLTLAVNQYRKQHSALLLFPLQSPNHLNYHCFLDKSVFQFVHDCLSAIDPSVGVLITQHPDDKVLNDDSIAYFREKFPHFIYDHSWEIYHSPSQFIVPLVDGMINLSSGLGFYALIHQKPIFCPHKSHFSALAEDTALSSVHTHLQSGKFKANDIVLAFLLTRYHFCYRYMHNPQWLYDRLLFLREQGQALAEDILQWPTIDSHDNLLDVYRKDKRPVKVHKKQ